MSTANKITKIARIFLWSTGSIVAFLILIAAAIQIPGIQHLTIQRVTSFVNNKISGNVSIARAGITFNGSIFIDGLYIEDPAQDTLLYAGNVKASIDLFALIFGNIHVRSVSLKNTFGIVSRTKFDTLFNYQFLQTAFVGSAPKASKSSDLHIRIDNVKFDNVRFTYDDRYSGVSVATAIDAMNLKMKSIDLKKLDFGINTLIIDGCTCSIIINENLHPAQPSSVQHDVHVSAINLELSNSSFSFDSPASSVRKYNFHDTATGISSGFDASRMRFSDIHLRADNIAYSPALIKAHVTNASARDSSKLYLSDFSTDFMMDEHGISASNFVLRTSVSNVNGSFALKYPSLAALRDSPDKMNVSATINHATIGVNDVLYFIPQTVSKDFLHGPDTAITVAGTITGPLGELSGDRIVIGVGDKTSLNTDFVITGLPDVYNMQFTASKLHVITGRNDIVNLLGKSNLPTGISLPESIELDAHGTGTLKTFETSLKLTSDYGTISARASLNTGGVYNGTIDITDFNAGLLLKNPDMFGPIDAQVDFTGKGLNKNSVNVKVTANASTLYLNRYKYQNVSIDGTITGTYYDGKFSVNDPHAVFDYDGLINVAPGKERYNFTLDIKKVDVQPLTIFGDDLRIAAKIVVDARGKDFDSFTGKVALSRIILVKQGIDYQLDSMVCTSTITDGERQITLAGDLIDMQYKGTVSPSEIAGEVKKIVNRYISVKNPDNLSPVHHDPQNFTITAQVHQHPLLFGVLLPQLTGYSPCSISVSFNTEKNRFLIKATFPKIEYSGTSVSNAVVTIDADVHKLDYQVSTLLISNGPMVLNNFLAYGDLQGQEATLILSSTDDNEAKKLFVKTKGTLHDSVYRISIDPSNVYIGNQPWTVSPDNFIELGDSGVSIHDLSFSSPSGRITLSSTNNTSVNTFKIGIVNLDLNDFSQLLVSDTSLIKGHLNADVLLEKTDDRYGLIADAAVSDISIRSISVGTFSIKADNSAPGVITVNVKLSGKGNDISADGTVITKKDSIGLDILVDINAVSIKAIEALSMGNITEGSGTISGSLAIKGNTQKPVVKGNLSFDDVFFNPSALNSRLHLKNENIEITPSGIQFNSFTILDRDNNSAQIDGVISVLRIPEMGFDLKIVTDNFLAFTTTQKNNDLFFGKMIVDSRISIQGSSTLPVIKSSLKLKNGSHLTFAVPERFVTADKGEGVVLFIDTSASRHLPANGKEINDNDGGLKGFEITSDIEIDEKATLRLLLDPASKDSFNLRGSGLFKFNLHAGGNAELSGRYTLTEGNYLVSFSSIIERKFSILRGGTIIFNGDPSDAEIDIKAVYTIITSPIDLVANRISGLSDAEKNGFRGRLPFLVYLNLRGALLHPDITFELQLLPEDKGALGGAVDAKLMQLNADPSSLDKQVFALLVLGRFLQENPIESSSSPSSFTSVARSGVSSFLSGQLKQWGAGVLPGLDLNLGIKSYDDFTSGEAAGRTLVEIGVQKQLFNDRLIVQAGGAVDVEGERAQQNTANEIAGDVVVEYKLTPDGRYRLKGFRKNIYEDPLDGQLTKTAIGISITRIFNHWKNLFRKPENVE